MTVLYSACEVMDYKDRRSTSINCLQKIRSVSEKISNFKLLSYKYTLEGE